jgi:hypothetical protein
MELKFPQEAYNTLIRKVYAPHFFNKLASYGIVAENVEEANNLLEIAATLRHAAMQHAAGASSVETTKNSFIKEALHSLKQVCNVETPNYSHYVKAAEALLQDPEVIEAASAYVNYFLQAANGA